MSVTQYHPEVQDRLFAFAEIVRDESSGKWMAYLSPYMLGQLDKGPLPPGQLVRLNPSTTELEVENDALLDAFERGEKPSLGFSEAWAARPYFHSWEAARKKILWWLNEYRKDLVDACIDETRQAIAYRARLGAHNA